MFSYECVFQGGKKIWNNLKENKIDGFMQKNGIVNYKAHLEQ